MKKFAWSWSKLKNWRTCPKRHYEVDLAKTYKEEEGEAILWGNQVHDAMAKRIAKGTPLPPIMQHYDDWPQRLVALRDHGFRLLTEQKLAMSETFRPTSFFDNATWFRGVVDVLALGPNAALAIDWKTGAVKPDYEQLALNAQLVFAHHPEIELVDTIYVWLGNDDETVKRYARTDMTQLWSGLLPEVKLLAEAHRTLTYPPKPSGICLKWCPVVSCPHYGKGRS